MTSLRFITIGTEGPTESSLDLSGGVGDHAYTAVAAGTGYSIGDTLLCQVVVTAASPYAFVQKWVNLNTGLEVAAPALADLQPCGALGQKTSAKSRSVVLASDHPAVPVAATSDVANIVAFPDLVYSGAITAQYVNDATPGGSLKVAIPAGYRSATIYLRAGDAFLGSVLTKVTDGVNGYQALQGLSLTSASTPINGFSSLTGTTTFFPAKFNIPAGMTHVSLQCSVLTSGACFGYIVLSTESVTTLTTGITILSSSTSRVGATSSPVIRWDDTAAALGTGATFTSIARDLFATASATAVASASAYTRQVAVSVEQDQPFTLNIFHSTDNANYRVKDVVVAEKKGANWVAEYVGVPVWRYFQYSIVNEVTAATRTTGVSAAWA